ncbi:hypothetical protein ACFOLD_06240 [Kocuria carniphila]
MNRTDARRHDWPNVGPKDRRSERTGKKGCRTGSASRRKAARSG